MDHVRVWLQTDQNLIGDLDASSAFLFRVRIKRSESMGNLPGVLCTLRFFPASFAYMGSLARRVTALEIGLREPRILEELSPL